MKDELLRRLKSAGYPFKVHLKAIDMALPPTLEELLDEIEKFPPPIGDRWELRRGVGKYVAATDCPVYHRVSASGETCKEAAAELYLRLAKEGGK